MPDAQQVCQEVENENQKEKRNQTALTSGRLVTSRTNRRWQLTLKPRDVLFSTECDLSAYRIRYKEVPHVVVLGSLPTPEIDGQLTKILEVGEPANLPQNIVITLAQRRIQAKRIGPWVEGHYRPGQQM